MATFISLINYTEKGLHAFKDTVRRTDQFRDLATAAGATVKDIYWTIGAHDGVLIFDAPDTETAAAILLKLSSFGNVKTETLPAFEAAELGTILNKV